MVTRLGQQLFSGSWGTKIAVCAVLIATPVAAAAPTHRVASGDSLWSIAKQHGVTVDALKRANALDGSKIRVGQVLKLPSGEAAPTPAPKKAEPAPPTATKPAPESNDAKSDDRAGSDSNGDGANSDDDSDPEAPEVPTLADAPTALEPIPAWVLERPEPGPTSPARKPWEAGPCNVPEDGLGAYAPPIAASRLGKLLTPRTSPIGDDEKFDLVVHFHGGDHFRRTWVRTMDRTILLSVDLGITSDAYARTFTNPAYFRHILIGVEHDVARRYGVQRARLGRLAVSAWGPGHGALGVLLDQAYGQQRIDSVMLLDGLHAGYLGDTLNEAKLAPYARFAQRAAARERFMFVSHSSILPKGYASTTETARYLVWKVGGQPEAATPRAGDPMGLRLASSYSTGNFHVRGFTGSNQDDHCAQLALSQDVLRLHVKPRWSEPVVVETTDDTATAKNE